MRQSIRRMLVSSRRRWTVAWIASLCLHALLVLFFGLHLVLTGGISSSDAPQSEAMTITTESAPAPQRTATPVTKTPTPVKTAEPKTVVRPVAARPLPRRPRRPPPPARPRVARAAPKRPELAKNAKKAPPQQTKIAALAPVSKAVPTFEPSATPTTPPTAIPKVSPAPVLIPTPPPSIAPTQVPTVPPTLTPTAPPTSPPTAPPTVAPTAAPTARPTTAPTAAPTVAPTAQPTEVPTVAPATATPHTAAPVVVVAVHPATAAPATAIPASAPPTEIRFAGHSSTPAPHPIAPVAGVPTPGQLATNRGNEHAGPQPQSGTAPGAGPKPGVPNPAPNPAPTNSVALNPRNGSNPLSNEQLQSLNSRLGNLLPGGTVVHYTSKSYAESLDEITAEVQREYYKKAAPPQKVLDKAQATVFQRRTATHPDQITYILSRRKLFGFEICSGWTVVLHPEGGGQPDGYYSFGLCSKSDFKPAYADEIPTISPHPSPTALRQPSHL